MNLIPWYAPGDQAHLEIGLELYERLKEKPDNTFCLVAMENGFCQGILIAYIRKNDIWLWQSRAKSGFKYSKLAMRCLFEWAKWRGYNTIKTKPNKRSAKLLARKYKFTPSDEGEMVYYV